jgi:predicted enzyme related to lactoylglutathione lyase
VAFRDKNKWAQFPTDTGRFAVSSREEAATPQSSSVIVFEVDDLLETETVIRQHGGSIISRRDMEGHGATVTFADPDGNVAQIFARIGK